MEEYIAKVETIEEPAIKLPEGFGEVGEKVHIDTKDDGSIVISKLVPIEIDLPNDVLLSLAMMAHEQDITLNELCNDILKEIVDTDGKCLGLEGFCQDCGKQIPPGFRLCGMCGECEADELSEYDKTTEGNKKEKKDDKERETRQN